MLSLEVNFLIYPAFALFLLMLIPVPMLSKLVARGIAKLESCRIYGVSPLFAIAVFGVLAFSFAYQKHYAQYGGDAASGSAAINAARQQNNIDYSRLLARKWRAERNLYMHGIVALLYCALLKMARLTLEASVLAKAAAAANSTAKKAEGVAEDKKKK